MAEAPEQLIKWIKLYSGPSNPAIPNDFLISGNQINPSYITSKQDVLISSTNIKTINNSSILGSGNITLDSWNKTGNAGTNPTTDFLGTTDNQPLVFRTNNVERVRMFTSGNIGINTTIDSGASLRINRNDYGALLEMVDGYYGYYFGLNLPTSPRGDRLHIFKNSSHTLYNNQGGGHSLLINGNSILRVGFGDGGVNKNVYLNETGGGNTLIGTATDAGFKLDVNGTVRIQNSLTLGNLASDPVGANGMIYYNTTTNKFRGYENGAWVNLI